MKSPMMIPRRRLLLSAAATTVAAMAQAQTAPGAKPLSILPGSTAPAAKPVAPAAGDSKDIVAKVNAYFNAIVTLTGDFEQVSRDGRTLSGKLFLHKPGKLRFQYNPPATVEVIADGSNVAIRDRRLNTQDLVSIKQTPLKFLLNRQVDLDRDVKLLAARVEGDIVRVIFEDRATFGGGTSRINLVFDQKSFGLKSWTVRDPQGQETNVRLANLATDKRPDPKLFVINYERMLDMGANR